MMRLRAAAAALAAALVAVVLTACAGLPTSGPVNAGVDIPDDGSSSDFVFIPKGPVEDATPQQIVEGFIAAGSGPGANANWATAREFLAPEFRNQWKPAGVTVYSAGDREPIQEISENEFVLTVTPVATLDAAGELLTDETGEIPLTYTLAQQSDGQWRITSAPDGIVLDQTRFVTVFNTYSLMYFDPTWTYLVPDDRWFPRVNAATSIAQALVNGAPSSWLDGAVTTAFTDDARLALAAVPVDADNVARVSLEEGARGLDQTVLDRMQTQLSESLKTASISGVDMVVDDQPLPADTLAVRRTLVDSRPLVKTPDAFGFASGDAVESIPGLSDAVLKTAATDVEVNADRTAAAIRDADGAVAVANADQTVVVLDRRSGLVAPSIDPFGFVWSAPSANPAAVTAYSESGAPIVVADAWPGAVEIVAQRVSRDGTRIAAVVRDGNRYALWVAGILRDRSNAPTGLGGRKVLTTLAGTPTMLTWLDASTLAVLAADDGESTLYTHEIGALGSTYQAPAGATTVAGGLLSGVRLRAADGELYAQRSANWQHLASDIAVLAVQQGAPR